MVSRRQDSPLILYTLGTSNRSLEEFVHLLHHYEIKQVIDVRSFPVSKRFPHFSRTNLKSFLPQRGLKYVWLGKELGGYRKEGYQNYLKTSAFQEGIEKLLALASKDLSVMICAERFPWRCHRRFIAQVLEEKGVEVLHIIDLGRLWRPSKFSSKLLMLPFPSPDE